eukprot:COSAG05_NODE_287_length_12131_cov_3.148022_11_plen_72_part_00
MAGVYGECCQRKFVENSARGILPTESNPLSQCAPAQVTLLALPAPCKFKSHLTIVLGGCAVACSQRCTWTR